MKTLQAHRSHMRLGLAGIVLSFACSATVTGQQTITGDVTTRYVDAERGVSMDQLVAMALERSPTIRAARARVEVARSEQAQAELKPNPTVLSDFREQVGGTDRQFAVGVNWPLELSRRSGRVVLADDRLAVAEQEAAEAERRLAAQVRAKALEVLAAARFLEVRSQVANTLTQFRGLVDARAASGTAPALERDVAEVDARRSRVDVIRQRSAAEAAMIELKGVMGLLATEPLVLRQTLEELGQASDRLSTPVEQLLKSRPDLRVAELQVKTMSAELDLVRRETHPDVSLNAAYMRMTSGFPLFGVDAAGALSPIQGVFHSVSFGASIMLPWRNRRQGDVAAGEARLQAARFDLDAHRIVATAEIEAARARVHDLEAAAAVYSGGLSALARKNVDVVRQSYELGRATLIDVLTETRRWLDTEMTYTDVLVELLQARNDLAVATGVIR